MQAVRSRVIAPFAAALMIGLTMGAPAQAAIPSGSNGQSEQAPNTGGSAQAREHRADDAQQSAPAKTGDSKSDTASEQQQPGDKPSSSNAAVQHERPNGWQAQADPDGDDNGGVDQPGGDGGTFNEDRFQDGNNGSGNDEDCEDDNRGKGVPGHCKDKPEHVGGVEGEPEPKTCPNGDVMPEDGNCGNNPPTTCPTGQVMTDGGECAEDDGGTTVVTPPASTPPMVTPPVVLPPQVGGNAGSPVTTPTANEVLGVEASVNPPAAGFVEDFAQPPVQGVELAAPTVLPQTGAAEYLTLLVIAGLGLATAGALTLLFRRRLESGR